MTRLDSAIRRLMAQRSVLDWASRDVENKPGLVLELGLGNGRTYDHLRDRLPNRDIFVFERSPAAHPSCMPPSDRLVVGDLFETLPVFLARFGPRSSILVHADLGTGNQEDNARVAARLSPLVEQILISDGLVVADRPFDLPRCSDISSDAGVKPGRYFVYRCR
jgi:hypothetical protein